MDEIIEVTPTEKKPFRLTFRKRTIFTAGLLALFILYVQQSIAFPFGSGLYPQVVGTFAIILLLVQLVTELLGRGGEVEAIDLAVDEAAKGKEAMRRAIRFFGWIMGIYAGTFLLGFNISMFAFYILFMRFEGHINWWLVLLLTTIAAGIQLYYFPIILGMQWPSGLLQNIFPDFPL